MFTGIVEQVGEVLEVKDTGGNRDLVIRAAMTPELRVDQSVSHNGVCLTVVGVSASLDLTPPAASRASLDLTTPAASRASLDLTPPAASRASLDLTPPEASRASLDLTPPAASRASLDLTPPATSSASLDQVSSSSNGLPPGCYRVTAVEETLKRSNIGQLRAGDGINLERSLRLGDRLDGHMVQGHVDTMVTCTGVDERDGSWWFSFQLPATAELLVEKGSVCLNGVSLTIAALDDRSFSVAVIPYTYDHTTFRTLRLGDAVNLEFDVVGKYVARLLAPRLTP